MSLRQRLAALFLLIVLLSGCAALVQEPRVALKEANMRGLDASGVDLELLLDITNPNPFDVSLLGYTFDLNVLTLPLSSGETQVPTLFPAGKETELRIPVRLKYVDLLEIIKRAPDPDKVPYQLNSILHLKTPLGGMSVPVAKSAVLVIPEPYRPAAYINRLRDALRGLR
jgi:LEA14-like dessication related protein